MTGKLKLLAGFAAGYVLGTRAGRERYDQLVAKAQGLWRDPRTQEKVTAARHVAEEKAGQAAEAAQAKVADTAQSVKDTVQEKTGGGDHGPAM